MNVFYLCQVAYQHLRRRIEIIGHDVKIPIIVQVEHHRGASGAWGHHSNLPRMSSAHLLIQLSQSGLRAVDVEPGYVNVAARFNPQQKFGVKELFSTIVQEHRVNSVTKRETHPGRDENVIPAISVNVANA